MRSFRWVSIGTKLLAVVMVATAGSLAGCGGGSGTSTAQKETISAQNETTPVDAEEELPLSEERYGARVHPGCPKRDRPPDDLNLGLDEWESPEIAGVSMATERGDFADVGLEVNTFVSEAPMVLIPYVVEGVDDIGVSHEPEVLLAKKAGAPIVILGTLVSQPTAALIWLRKSKIGGIAGLKGKTIGISGLPYQEELLKKMLAKGGLTRRDVTVKIVRYELVSELVSGHVDAIFGRRNLQGPELEARGLKPVITPVQALGIPSYDELVLIARADCVSKRPQVFRRFMSALARGTAAAVKDPNGIAHAVRAGEEPNPEIGRKAMRLQIEATLPLLSGSR